MFRLKRCCSKPYSQDEFTTQMKVMLSVFADDCVMELATTGERWCPLLGYDLPRHLPNANFRGGSKTLQSARTRGHDAALIDSFSWHRTLLGITSLQLLRRIQNKCQTICSSTNHRRRPRGSAAVSAGKMHRAALSQASPCPESVRGKPRSCRRPVRCRSGWSARRL